MAKKEKMKIKLSKQGLESFCLDDLLEQVRKRKKIKKKQKALNKKKNN